ncbi:MAG: NHL repeat-containing protein, partial [Actinomycetota bacterium]|nr:NHL repeat-containing protein [Actinomycetota bacterium]
MTPRLLRIALAIAIVAVAQPLAVSTPGAYAAIAGGYHSVAVRPEVSGTYATPYGIAVDSGSNAYVADTLNHRVKKVSPAGQVLAIWGSRGATAGLFERPEGIAVSSDGRVFVADTGNNRIQVLAADGQHLAVWNATSGLYRPTGLTFDAAGNLYVADTGKHRIVKFSSAGTQIAVIGAPGAGNVQFNGPHGLAADATHLYVADTGNRRIQKLTLAGAYATQWGPVEVSGTTYSRYGTPYGVAVGAGGSLFVVDLAGIKDAPANPASAVYWVERCSNTGGVLNKWGTAGTGLGQYRTPGGVAARPDGGVYVADSGNNRIQVLDAGGVATAQWSGAGSGNGELNGPRAAIVGPDDMTYVADTDNNRIQVFDAAGAYVRQWGGVSRPTDLVFDAAGDVWIVERAASRLARFSTAGTPLGTIGTGSLTAPEGIARAANGDLWVADTGGARLVRLAPAGGAPLQIIGPTFTGGPGTFAAPTDLAVAADGRLWVVDRDGARVVVLEPN